MAESGVTPALEPSEMTPINTVGAQDVTDGQGVSAPIRRKTYRLSDLNIPKPKKKVISTFFGVARTPATISWLEWVYMALSMLSLTASVAITIDRIIDLRREHSERTPNSIHIHSIDDTRSDFTFAILLLWTAACGYYHVIIAIICERPYDLVTFMASSIIVWAYVVINFIKSPDPPSGKLIRLVISSALVPLIVGIGFLLCRRYLTSRAYIFNTVGGNVETQKMFIVLLIHDSLLKFDVQIGGSVLILWIQKSFIENQIDTTEIVVASVGIVITTVWLVIAYLAIRLENKGLVYAFYASSWLEPAVVIVNLVRTVELDHSVVSLIVSAYTCGIIALVNRFLTVYTMYLVSQNFGKGLKKKIFMRTTDDTAEEKHGQRKEVSDE